MTVLANVTAHVLWQISSVKVSVAVQTTVHEDLQAALATLEELLVLPPNVSVSR